jgi:hypothetical protein
MLEIDMNPEMGWDSRKINCGLRLEGQKVEIKLMKRNIVVSKKNWPSHSGRQIVKISASFLSKN